MLWVDLFGWLNCTTLLLDVAGLGYTLAVSSWSLASLIICLMIRLGLWVIHFSPSSRFTWLTHMGVVASFSKATRGQVPVCRWFSSFCYVTFANSDPSVKASYMATQVQIGSLLRAAHRKGRDTGRERITLLFVQSNPYIKQFAELLIYIVLLLPKNQRGSTVC